MSWPATADGDVFRRLQSSGFDFTSVHEIDFNVDFKDWPAPQSATQWIEREFGNAIQCPFENGFGGYIQFQIVGALTYDLVMSTQARVSQALVEYDGVCESWGVLQPLQADR